MGVPAEAGQQEVEVGQLGNPVLADVIASSVGQQGDGLSCWIHLEKRCEAGKVGGRGREREESCFYDPFFLNTVQEQKLFNGVSFPHVHTLPDRIFRPSARFLECSCSSWILLDKLLWAG